MIVFWLVAALFVAGALLLLLPPLWQGGSRHGVASGAASLAVHREAWASLQAEVDAGVLGAEQLAAAQRELEQRALDDSRLATAPARAGADRRAALMLGLLLPAAAALLYLQLGRPEAVVPQPVAAAPAAGGSGHALSREQIQQRVAALAERLREQPADAEGWLMLGRSYTALGRYADGATALKRAVDLLPPDAGLLADLADLTGMAQGKRLAGEPARLVQAALDLDPRHIKALALAGSVAFEARDYAAARDHWERLAAQLPPESPLLRSVRGSIAEATQLEGGVVTTATATTAAVTPATAPAPSPAPAAPAAELRGEVELAPELAGRVAPTDTLFVFARAVEGPRMPLAVQRLPAGAATRWAFVLDDRSAMAPQWRLSGQSRVVVGVRISKSGQATPQPGDLVGESAPVAVGERALRVRIDRVQP